MTVGHRRSLLAGAVALVATLAAAPGALGATFTVTQTGDTTGGSCTPASCSLRQAIAAAHNGDTVIVPASSTPYTLTQGQLTVAAGMTIQGAGAASTTIKAADNARVMVIGNSPSAVRLVNLTITGGSTTGPGGGGIATSGPGALILSGVTVSGNHVAPAAAGFNEGGGGIYSLAHAPVTLQHSTVSNNTVVVTGSTGDSGGGGIMMTAGDLVLDDSTVSGNTATVTASNTNNVDNNGGGGIYDDGNDLTVDGSLIQRNTTTITNNIVTTPADGGGGIYQFGVDLLLENSTVAGNVAHGPGVDKGGGGGIFDDGDSSQYINSTITGNSTDEPAATGPDANSDGGGGVLFDTVKGGVTMANMTITGNGASAAAGGGLNDFLTTAVTITDSIVAGNTAHADGNCAGPMISAGYNLADDTTADTCAFTATGDLLRSSAGLGSLADNGGPAPTEALEAGSSAIDAGNPAGCGDLLGNMLLTDERGVARPQPPGGRCDIGAYERSLPVVQTSSSALGAPRSAKLMATVGNPDAKPGSISFQYGTTRRYGKTTKAQAAPALTAGSSYSTSLTGLIPGVYHFRVVVTNAVGTTDGPDHTFTIKRVAARRLSLSARLKMSLHQAPNLAVHGHLTAPAGIPSKAACKGTVTVHVTMHGKTIATAKAKIGHSCGYSAKLRLGRKPLTGPFTFIVQMKARFGGNSVLTPISARELTVGAVT